MYKVSCETVALSTLEETETMHIQLKASQQHRQNRNLPSHGGDCAFRTKQKRGLTKHLGLKGSERIMKAHLNF